MSQVSIKLTPRDIVGLPYAPSNNANTILLFQQFFKGDKGDQGIQGKSAYQVWLDDGHTGSAEDFINDIDPNLINAALDAIAARENAIQPSLSLNFRRNVYRIYDSFANSYKEKILTDILTISNGAATGFDAKGLLKTSSVDSARLVFDPLTGESLGLLHEAAVVNLLLQANAFDQSPWAASGGTFNLNKNALSIDGGTNAWTFEDTDATVVSARRQTITIPNDSNIYCLSTFCKAGSTGKLYFRQAMTGGSAVLLTGVFNIATLSWESGSGFHKVLADGRVCVWVNLVNNSTGNTTLDFRIGSTGTAGSEIGTVIFERAQVNLGLFPSSYVDTTVSSVSRLADKYFRTLSNEFNPREGTFVFEGRLDFVGSAGSALMCLSDGTYNNRVMLWFDGTGKPAAFISNGGVATVNQTIDAGYVVGTPFIAAMSFKANSCILSFNGVSVEDISVTIPSGLNQFAIGRIASAITTQIYTGTIALSDYVPKWLPANVLNLRTSKG